MIGFFLAFAATALAGLGASDQALLTRLWAAGSPRVPLLAIALATAGLSAGLAGWAGGAAALHLAVSARLWLGALVLGIAGIRRLRVAPLRHLEEPTRSLGAAAIVLFALQIGDASRMAILAIALSLPSAAIGWGGALGSAATLLVCCGSGKGADRF